MEQEGKRKLRCGFIGCGPHASQCLYPALAYIPEVELVAVCDRNQERAQWGARTFGAERCYTDIEAMLAGESLDAAFVVGPPQMHFEVGQRCLEAGLHLFVEKPPAPTFAQARQLAHSARQTGRLAMVAFCRRHSPCYQIAKRISRRTGFGPITLIEIRFTCGSWTPQMWGLSTPLSFLIGVASHMFDLVRYLAGEVVAVYARWRQTEEARFGFAITLECHNGALALLNINSLETWHGLHERLTLTGDGHFLEAEDQLRLRYYPAEARWAAGERPESAETVTSGFLQGWERTGTYVSVPEGLGTSGYRQELAHFVQCVLRGQQPEPGLEDGAEALRIAEAAWESVNSGRRIKLPGGQDARNSD